MKTVRLNVPAEIIQEAAIPYEGVRDLHGIVVAIDSINLTASIVTLATLKQYAPALAAAIRRWRLHRDTKPMTLTVKGDGIDLTIELPPNVSSRQLLRQLAPLLDRTK